jgi:subtilisin
LVPGSTPIDEHGHGTQMLSVIYRISPHVQFIPIKIFDRSGISGKEALAEGIRWAVDYGARIINVSAGVRTTSLKLEEAVRYAEEHNTVIVAATGRMQDNPNAIDFPAAYENVIGVGAVGNNCKLLESSPKGKGLFLVTFGEEIEVTGLKGKKTFESGTSVATAVVSGIIANMIRENQNLTPVEVRSNLLKQTKDIYAQGWDTETGYGVISTDIKQLEVCSI